MEGQVRVKSVTIVDPTHAPELFIAGPNLVRPGNEVVMLTLCNMRSDVKHSGSERATSAELTRDDMVVEVVTRIVLPKSIARVLAQEILLAISPASPGGHANKPS
jgi:hypothetical protein